MSDSNLDSSGDNGESNVTDSYDEEVTPEAPSWADSDNSGSEICTVPVEDWVEDLTVGPTKFETTEDVPLPKRLVDQVIGQDAA